MIYPSIDKLLNLVDSKYRLVHIVAKKSDEMTNTDYLKKKESEYVSTKNIGRALEEIADGLIKITTEKEEKGKIKLQ